MKTRRFFVDLMQGPSEVTGSMILAVVKIDDVSIKFVVDCGIYQERDYEELNTKFITDPKTVDFMLLTHNHVDHNGRIPYFAKKGFEGKIYTSTVTSRILHRALNDNARILKDSSKRRNMPALYDAEDVEKVMKQVNGVEYNKPVRVNEYITITMVPNGHLIGAASILIQIHAPGEEKDINLFFSGDYSNKNVFWRVPPIRKWITELPITCITESTYGAMESKQITKCFNKNVLNAIKEQKDIIIPVFSLGRAQEILYYLKDMQEKNPGLFGCIPIYYDGKLSFYYTNMYYKLQEEELLKFYKEKADFLPKNLVYVEDKHLRKKIIEEKKPKIIVTTSGMGSYGPAQTYLPEYMSKPNALIHFTGYCAEDTLGYRLKNTPKGEIVDVAGAKCIKQALVEFSNEFSAHSKADELIAFWKKFTNMKCILVNHGQSMTKDKFGDRLLTETSAEKGGVLGGEYLFRIGPNGFIKTLNSKLL